MGNGRRLKTLVAEGVDRRNDMALSIRNKKCTGRKRGHTAYAAEAQRDPLALDEIHPDPHD
jgi:hypothetical protein